MTSADISVIIPTYNGSAYIAETVRSVLAQTLLPTEIIVVDDCSTDDTAAIVEQLSMETPCPIRLIRRQQGSGGPAVPTNEGIAAAHSEWISLLDHDDRMLPDKLELQLAACQAMDANLCFSNFREFQDDGQYRVGLNASKVSLFLRHATESTNAVRIPGHTYLQEQILDCGIIQSCSNLLLHRSLFATHGGLDIRSPAIADFLFKLQIAGSVRPVFIPKVLFEKRIHARSLYAAVDGGDLEHEIVDAALTAVEEHPELTIHDRHFRKRLQSRLLGWAYHSREQGRLATSLRRYWQTLRYTGPSIDLGRHMLGWLPAVVRDRIQRDQRVGRRAVAVENTQASAIPTVSTDQRTQVAGHRDNTASPISVVIPTYNGSAFVAEALRSVFTQTLLPTEVIVVDDCSTDGTVNRVEALREESPIPLHVIRLAANSGGPSKPINTGIEHATGSLISVLDQDDVFLPDTLERAARALTENHDADFAFHWCAFLGDNARNHIQPAEIRDDVVSQGTPTTTGLRFTSKELLPLVFSHASIAIGYPGFVFRTSAWVERGGIDERWRVAGDLDFFLRLAANHSSVLIPEVGYLRREHEANICGNRTAMHLEVANVMYRACSSLSTDHRAALAPRVRERLSSTAYWFREGHKYAESEEVYRLAANLGVSRFSTWNRLWKLRFHQFLARITATPPRTNSLTGTSHGLHESAGR